MVRSSMFNIRNGRNGGLELAQVWVDFGVLQETKLTNGVYMQEASNFRVMAMEVPSAHRVGVTIFYCEAEYFSIKELRLHGVNVISF